MKIIKHKKTVSYTVYSRVFHWASDPGSGFAFECDEHGQFTKVDNDAAYANWAMCLEGKDAHGEVIIDDGVEVLSGTYIEEAIGECGDCRRHVRLGEFTCECECGALYNWGGQRLAPQSQWEEEW
jgi:hypothetical protein